MYKKHIKFKTINSILKKKNKELQQKNKKLEQKIYDLKKDLEFMHTIFDNSYSAVSNLRIKTINGKKIWIDRVNISNQKNLLFKLDKDKEVKEWIDNLYIRYNDNDW
jgi:hypothetical protein